MKKLLLTLGIIFLSITAFADDTALPIEIGNTPATEPVAIKITDITPPSIIDNLPPLKNMALYSINDGGIKYGALLDVLKWKGLALSVGYVPSDSIIAGVSYDLFTLSKFGVETPIIKNVGLEPFIGYSLGRLNLTDTSDAKESVLVGINVVNIRFW
jgi:hypothetical protein